MYASDIVFHKTQVSLRAGTKVAPDVAMHPAICSLLKSDRGGEGILMVNIDQFDGNRPSIFTPNCRVYNCFAVP